jgi:cell division protein FtsB
MSKLFQTNLFSARLLFVVLVMMTIWLQYHTWYGESGMEQLQILKVKIEQQSTQNNLLVQQNKTLKTEIQLLRNDPDALEEKAREHLGLIKKDEIFYRVIPSEL